jgi:outer membrane protein TolC
MNREPRSPGAPSESAETSTAVFPSSSLRRVRAHAVRIAATLGATTLCALASPSMLYAQPAGQPPAGQPAAGQPAAQPTGPKPDELGPGEQTGPDKPDPLLVALAPQPGGLTLDGAAREAIATSTQVRAKEIEIEGADGAVSQTVVQFFPRLTLGASYTRLSSVDSGGLGGGAIVGAANEGAISVGPCPDNPASQCALDSAGVPLQAASFSFPVILNQIAFTANLTVPISDYFLRATQAYAAANHNSTALELQADAQRLQAGANAKLTTLNWILAKGQVVVADRSVEQAKAQLADAKVAKEVGNASVADVMRIEALLAQADFTAAEARAQESVAEQQLRIVLHAEPTRQLTVGVDVLTPPAAPALPSSDELVREAIANRLELKATDEQKQSLEDVESTTAAAYWPRLDGFADANLANPNQRIFPSQEKFDFTWDVGVRLSWTLNDTFSTLGASAQAKSRTAQVDAQKQLLIESIRLEVVQAHADVVKAAPSLEAADRGVVAAEEALRVTKKLFAFGKATGTAVADAETAVTQARLRKLSAHVGLHAALVRLDHALGRDARTLAKR